MVDARTFFPLRKFPMARRVAKMCLKVSLFCNSRIDSFRSISGSATSYENRSVLLLMSIKIFCLPTSLQCLRPTISSHEYKEGEMCACVIEETCAEITDYKPV